MNFYVICHRLEYEEGLPFPVPENSDVFPPEWFAEVVFPSRVDKLEPFLWSDEN